MGCINGLIVTKGRIVPFVATLGTMSAVRGLVLVYTDQKAIMGTIPGFEFLGGGSVGFIPTPFIFAFLILVIFHNVAPSSSPIRVSRPFKNSNVFSPSKQHPMKYEDLIHSPRQRASLPPGLGSCGPPWTF